MTEHVTAWLEAYHDGELGGRRLRQVESHLAGCPTCRAELEALQALSALLGESPAASGLMPAERFVAQVGLRLPRRPERSAWQRALGTGWRLAPLGLFGAWAFIQATFIVAGVVLLGLQLGLDGELAALLPPSQGGAWLSELAGLSGAGLNGLIPIARHVLSREGPLGWGVTLNLGLSALIGLLYWSWLATWWAHRRHRQLQG